MIRQIKTEFYSQNSKLSSFLIFLYIICLCLVFVVCLCGRLYVYSGVCKKGQKVFFHMVTFFRVSGVTKKSANYMWTLFGCYFLLYFRKDT